MSARIILFGGTDLTLSLAETLEGEGLRPAGIITVAENFRISYSPGKPIANARFADIAGWARKCDVPCYLYAGAEGARAFISECSGDIGLVAGWYHMVDSATRALLPRGCLGLHASLLPRLRGGAPLSWAILTEREETGLTLFELGEGIDDGPIYAQERFPIARDALVGDLIAQSEAVAVDLVKRCFPKIAAGELKPKPQTGTPSYSMQRMPEDGRIDWDQSAAEIERLVRASGRPYYGAFSRLNGGTIRFWRVNVVRGTPPVFGVCGQIARIPEAEWPLIITRDGLVSVHAASDEAGSDAIPLLWRSANQRLHSEPLTPMSSGATTQDDEDLRGHP